MSGYEHTFSRLGWAYKTSRGKTDLNGVGKGEKFSIYGKCSLAVCEWERIFRRKASRESIRPTRKRIFWEQTTIFMEISANTSPTKYQRESLITDTTKAILCIAVRILCALFRLYSAGVGSLEYIELWYSINFRKGGRDNNKKLLLRTSRMWNFPSVFCYDFSFAHTFRLTVFEESVFATKYTSTV